MKHSSPKTRRLMHRRFLARALLWLASVGAASETLPFARGATPVEAVAPYFESGFPFFQSTVDLTPLGAPKSEPKQAVARGILLPLPNGECVLFDQENLRLAAWWKRPEGGAPVTLASMSQVSYAEPHRKAGTDLPRPAATPHLVTVPQPGIHASVDTSTPAKTHSKTVARFAGIELKNRQAVLHMVYEGTLIKEQYNAAPDLLHRSVEIGPHTKALFLHLAPEKGGVWQLKTPILAAAEDLQIQLNALGARLEKHASGILARIEPSQKTERLVIQYAWKRVPQSEAQLPTAQEEEAPRWPETLTTAPVLNSAVANGLALDALPLPVQNPWKRRIRPADIAFLSEDRAAIVTFDGDVWIAEGLSPELSKTVRWRRYASGLNEPLSIAEVKGVLQVYSRNGLVRLYDRKGTGEADWYENFSDDWTQSAGSRAFALDMAVDKDGSTVVSQGGIARTTPFAGAITRISADGRNTQILSERAREPYVTLHPTKGWLTSTDQQGNFIPSSVCYLVRKGDNFGFGEEHPQKLTSPLVWIPHTVDNSSASQVWLDSPHMGPLAGRLLHLSYGRGLPLLICPDLDAPVPQGAVIPTGLETNLPLLHGRMHPAGDSVFVCGFQIYDSRVSENWGVGRIRLDRSRVTFPIEAKSIQDGVFISFASPLAPETVIPENILAAAWNYQRTKDYGSGRFRSSGLPGVDAVPVGQVLLSKDRKTVFVHLPDLKPVHQLEVGHDFALQSGERASGSVYFTIHETYPLRIEDAGFENVDLSKSVPVTRLPTPELPTIARGKQLSVQLGCIACHSTDGGTEGKTGPTWKGLFGKDRLFADGSIESANEFYIRTSILEPQKKIVSGYQPGMASYAGIISDDQLESIILYIRSLK